MAKTAGPWIALPVAFALLCVANGRWYVAPAAWIAPVLLLVFVQSQPPRRGLALAFLAQAAAFCVNWWGMIPVPGVWYYVVAVTYAAVYFVPFVAHRLVAPRLAGLASSLVFPLSWVGIEILFQRFATPYGSWGSLAYTQTGFLPLLQLASVTGLGGVHFLMTWCAAVAALAWRHRAALSRVRAEVATCTAVVLAALAWGHARLASAPQDADTLAVSGITVSSRLTAEFQQQMRAAGRSGSAVDSLAEALLAAADRVNGDLLARTESEARARPDLIVWSEHAARVTRQTEPSLVGQAQSIARSSGVRLILGIGLWDPASRPAFENKAVLLDETGAVVGTYFKARPIVGQEAGILGAGSESLATIDTARGRFATAICHDLDFPQLMREAGAGNVDVILAPSSDWAAITPFHALMAIPRAIENGAPLVRPAADGLSLVVDPLGRVVASQLDLGGDGNVLRARLPLYRLRTLYPRIGDAFAWACLIALAAMLLAASRRRALA